MVVPKAEMPEREDFFSYLFAHALIAHALSRSYSLLSLRFSRKSAVRVLPQPLRGDAPSQAIRIRFVGLNPVLLRKHEHSFLQCVQIFQNGSKY